MAERINRRNVLKALEHGPKSVEEIGDYLGLRCNMDKIHNEDEITAVLRNLHSDDEIRLTLDREYEINE